MLRIEPTFISLNFKSDNEEKSKPIKSGKKESEKSMITGTLIGLAAVGAAVLGVKKTSPISYEEALKKAGVEVKNNIATLIESGEKFTGKIQRFEKRNRKETVEFVDGVITEKLYHNLMGKELGGEFYKNGKQVLRIWASAGQKKNSYGFVYSGEGIPTYEFGPFVETKEGFAWAREYIKNMK